MKYRDVILCVPLALVVAPIALAHPGHDGGAAGIAAGWAHPFFGVDHVLAMIAVGLLAGQRGGRATWLLPVSFIACMVVGGLLALGAMPLPFVEHGIMGSVLVLGVVVMLATRAPYSAVLVLPIASVVHAS